MTASAVKVRASGRTKRRAMSDGTACMPDTCLYSSKGMIGGIDGEFTSTRGLPAYAAVCHRRHAASFITRASSFEPGGSMRPIYRLAISGALALCVPCVALNPGSAQEPYPSKPIHLVVTTAAGGANDLVARAVAERLSESLRQPVIIENQPAATAE